MLLIIVGRAFGGGPFRRQIIYFKFLDALQSDRSVAVTDDDDDDDVLMIMINTLVAGCGESSVISRNAVGPA